jgi:HEAT repeats
MERRVRVSLRWRSLHSVIWLFIAMCSFPMTLCGQETKSAQGEKALVQFPKRFHLAIKASTWRKGEKPFDFEEDIRKTLKKSSLEVVDAKDNDFDATLSFDYKELRGMNYIEQSDTSKKPAPIIGTNIRCTIQVTDNKRRQLFSQKINLTNDSFALVFSKDFNQELYNMASQKFLDHPAIKYLDKMILAAYGKGDRVSVLIEALKDDSSDTGAMAAEALGHSGDKRAVQPLLDAFLNGKFYDTASNSAIREALEALGWKPTTLQDRIHLLLKEYENSPSNAQDIRKMGQKATPILVSLLKGENAYFRAKAILALGDLKDRAAVDELIAFLNDESVQMSVINSLGKIGDPRATAPLGETAQKNPNASVRAESLKAIDNIKKSNK